MTRKAWHIVLPTMMSAIFFLIAATPVDALGCRTRGLLALLVALVSGIGAVGAAIIAVRGQSRRDVRAPWWVVSAGLLAIPVIALIILA